jgi:Uma2 family endonuclease
MATIAAPLVLGPADHGRTMTLDEFLEAEIEEGYRYELGRGVLEVTQVPNDPHRQVVTNLYDAIGRYRRTNSRHRLELRRRLRVPTWASWDGHRPQSGSWSRPPWCP